MTPLENRRRHRRLGREEWPDTVSGRIRPGHQVRVIDLSSSGALIESARRLSPGGWAELHLETGDQRHMTRAAVVRCYVSDLRADALVFRSALAFERCIPWFASAEDLSNLIEPAVTPSHR